MKLRSVGAALVVLALSLLPGEAFAQARRLKLDDLVIEGSVQKPEAFFILPRASLNFEELKRREDLKQRIVESVKKDPF